MVNLEQMNRNYLEEYTSHDAILKYSTKSAGHGINYRNILQVNHIPHLTELNIGHSIVARAIWVGIESAVSEMLALMQNYRG